MVGRPHGGDRDSKRALDVRWTVEPDVSFAGDTNRQFGPLPASYAVSFGEFVAKPDGGPTWQVRSTLTLLLPRSRN